MGFVVYELWSHISSRTLNVFFLYYSEDNELHGFYVEESSRGKSYISLNGLRGHAIPKL